MIMHIARATYPTVFIVIVNWNGKKYLRGCFSSLQELIYPKQKLKIILVDNGSSDGSVSWVKKIYPKTMIIQNNENLGFAKANNMGISFALRNKEVSYIVTLNNDTKVDRYWIKHLIDFMEKNKKVGVAVGKILQFYNRNIIDSAGDFLCKDNFRVVNRGYNERDQGQYYFPQEIFSACAAASVFRRETLEQIKINNEFFDEDFVSYIEDVDLNVRARLKNWLCFYVPDAVVYHIGSATSSKISKEYKEYLSRRNRILFAVKNFPLFYLIILLLHYILPSKRGSFYYFSEKIKHRLKKRGNKFLVKNSIFFHIKKTYKYYMWGGEELSIIQVFFVNLRALYSALKLLPKMIKKRKIIQKNRQISEKEVIRWFKNLVISQP